jgi:hypothetical protein
MKETLDKIAAVVGGADAGEIRRRSFDDGHARDLNATRVRSGNLRVDGGGVKDRGQTDVRQFPFVKQLGECPVCPHISMKLEF